jgi:hypothetical protein
MPVIFCVAECVERATTANSKLSFLGRCESKSIHIAATTSSRLALVIGAYTVKQSGAHDSTLKHSNLEIQATVRNECQAFARETRKVKAYAVVSTSGSSHRGGCSAVAGQSLHSNAGIHQVNLEWGSRHRSSAVAAQCIRAVSLPFGDPHRKRITIGVTAYDLVRHLRYSQTRLIEHVVARRRL